MHTGGLTLFLVGVAVIGLAPLVMLLVYFARRAHDARREDGREQEEGGGPGGPLRALAAGLVVLALLTLGVAWYLNSTAGSTPVSQQGMAMDGSAPMGGPSMAAPGMLPRTLVGLPVTDRVTGSEAVRQVAQLHGTEFPIASAEIGRYGNGSAVVWVARSSTAAVAAAMARRMAARISEGGSPFDPPERVASLPGVWSTHGMGQVHYFFARGDAVWWLSADPGIARRALTRILKVAG